MIKEVIKADGRVESFDLGKLSKWSKYASKVGGNWSILAVETFTKLPERCSSEDIHKAMIDVCYSKQDLVYSRVAARLEIATILKNMERVLGLKINKSTFKDVRKALLDVGLWDKNTIPEYSEQQEVLYEKLKSVELESWQISQWSDKYLLKLNGVVVETPVIAAIGIGLGLHGDTQDAYDLSEDIIYSRTNLPTPVLNGIRNGDFNGVSCCVISGGDSVESIEVAQHLAVRMTAKKAGIGIEFTTRSKGADVKNGRIKHLGKHPIYRHIDSGVKQFTQETRGGSATVSFTCIDPEVYNIALWKSQRIDIEQRLDKLDYSFVFNDAFIDAVINRKDWYLFDYGKSPEVYDVFYRGSVDEYNLIVEKHKDEAIKTVSAIDLIKHILLIRQETGRLYCFNVSRANTHTPFNDTIRLSNLCVAPETMILTRNGYKVISELENENVEVWNGKEWSKVTVVKTGENQKVVKVHLSEFINNKKTNNVTLVCTHEHKWYDRNGNVLRTHELQTGLDLLSWTHPNGDKISHLYQYQEEHENVDTYCFTEPKRNMGVFNGILTGQCQEICLPTKPYTNMQELYSKEGKAETAFCSLGAIVPVNIKSDEEYERVAYTLVKTINTLIDKCPKMTENHERTMLERKSLGVGITGLAEYLYKNNLDYVDSETNLEFVADLAEKHCFYLYKASQTLAKQTGKYVEGVDLNWLPIDTKLNKYAPKMDWESLRGKPRLNSVLVAHMPTESSALASGVTNGLYPPRQRIINKKSRKGVVQFICKDFVQGKNLLAWAVDNILLSKYYSVVQDYTDQAISADGYFDPRNYEGGKKPVSLLIKEWVAHFKLGNKSMYYVNTYDNDESSIFDIAQDDCESCKL